MSASDTIISINNDPEAAIFKVSDLGIVGNMFDIVPEFINQLKEYKLKKQDNQDTRRKIGEN